MTKRAGTGGVTGRRVSARDIVTGFKSSGAPGDAVLEAALNMLDGLDTGDVTGEEAVKASGDIVTGVLLDLGVSDREGLVAEMRALREMLAELQEQPEAAAVAEAAADSLDDAIAEAQKEKPLGKRVVKRLRDTVEFITDAGKALEAADKAGPLLAKAIPTAVALYQLAQGLF